MRLNRLKKSAIASTFIRPWIGKARDTRRSTLAEYGNRYVLRSISGRRFEPPAPRIPVSTRFAGGALPVTVAVNGAPDEMPMTGAIVKSRNHTDDAFGCQTALALKRCGMSNVDVPSSSPRLNGLSTLFPVVNVCEDCPLSVAFEKV